MFKRQKFQRAQPEKAKGKRFFCQLNMVGKHVAAVL